MEARHFVYKLIPPRPTFDRDMDEQEAAVMARHAGYWGELTDKGTAVLFGPVSDPAGSWGLAVVEAPTEEEVRRLGDEDPAVTSGTARYEVYPMPVAVVRGLPHERRAPSPGVRPGDPVALDAKRAGMDRPAGVE